jgi:hypothetical protein
MADSSTVGCNFLLCEVIDVSNKYNVTKEIVEIWMKDFEACCPYTNDILVKHDDRENERDYYHEEVEIMWQGFLNGRKTMMEKIISFR